MQAANHAHAAPFVKEAATLLGQLFPRLNRRPFGFHNPLAGLVPPTEPIRRNPEVADRRARWCKPLLRLRPNPSDQLYRTSVSIQYGW
jgi:hypothetical protein